MHVGTWVGFDVKEDSLKRKWLFVRFRTPFFFGYLSGSDPSNSPVAPLSNTLVVCFWWAWGELGLERAKQVSRRSQANPRSPNSERHHYALHSWWLDGIVVVAKVDRMRGLGFDHPQGFTFFFFAWLRFFTKVFFYSRENRMNSHCLLKKLSNAPYSGATFAYVAP